MAGAKHSAADLDHHEPLVLAAKTQAMVFESDDAGLAWLEHPHFGPRPQAHLFEPRDEGFAPADIQNGAGFSGIQEMQRNDVRHAGAGDDLARKQVTSHANVETNSQLD